MNKLDLIVDKTYIRVSINDLYILKSIMSRNAKESMELKEVWDDYSDKKSGA